MERRNIILLGILFALILSSGFLLYRSFNAQPFSLAPVTISSDDVQRQNEAESLKQKMNRAMRNIDPAGPLDKLTGSPQFQELSADAIRSVEVGTYGRQNPFLPPGQ